MVLKAFLLPPQLSQVQHTPINNSSLYTQVTEMHHCDFASPTGFPFPPSSTLPVAWSWGYLGVSAPKVIHLHLPTSTYQLLKSSVASNFPGLERVHIFNSGVWPVAITYFTASFLQRDDYQPCHPQNWPWSFYKGCRIHNRWTQNKLWTVAVWEKGCQTVMTMLIWLISFCTSKQPFFSVLPGPVNTAQAKAIYIYI